MTLSDDVRVLELTRERVSSQTDLRQPFTAVDAAGQKVSPFSSDAVLFCGYAALLRSAYEVLGNEIAAHAMGEKLAYKFSPLGSIDLMQIGYQGGREEFLSVIDQLLDAARPPPSAFLDRLTIAGIVIGVCLSAAAWLVHIMR